MTCQPWVSRAVASLIVVVLAPITFAETKTTTPFKGVTLHERTETSPRPLKIHVVEIDLKAPGIRFRVTPSNGETPGETNLQTTREFLVKQKAQLAINASFYKLVQGKYGDTVGLTASDGDAYSEFTNFPTLNLSKDNTATFVTQAKRDQSGVKTAEDIPPYNAISGNEFILREGKNVAEDKRLHPRTAIGVAPDDTLVLITVDGRQKGVSEGMTTVEVAHFMRQYGVTDAINLDGGGSTTLAVADPEPRVVNVPVGSSNKPGSERRNASNLAVFAEPQTRPASGTAK